MSPEDVQLYYQIALGGRRDLPMAPEPRLGFEMTLLRMLAFRPDAATVSARHGGRAQPAADERRPQRVSRLQRSQPGAAVHRRTVRRRRHRRCGGARDRCRQLARGGGGRESQRHGAPVCLELRARPPSRTMCSICGSIRRRRSGARAPSRRSSCKGLSKYLGRDIRIVFEVSQATLATPARQRAIAEQDKVVRAAAAFEEDPAVKGLRERFGAEVDAASVKPANQHLGETIMMKGGLGNLMRQAQQMQETMQKAQAELADLEVTGESGAGMVKVVLNGRHEAKKVTIEPKLVGEDLGHARRSAGRGRQRCGTQNCGAQPGKICGTHVRNESPARHEAAVLSATGR